MTTRLLSALLAAGIFLAGCDPGSCNNRNGATGGCNARTGSRPAAKTNAANAAETAERFFGLHLDFHAHAKDQNIAFTYSDGIATFTLDRLELYDIVEVSRD